MDEEGRLDGERHVSIVTNTENPSRAMIARAVPGGRGEPQQFIDWSWLSSAACDSLAGHGESDAPPSVEKRAATSIRHQPRRQQKPFSHVCPCSRARARARTVPRSSVPPCGFCARSIIRHSALLIGRILHPSTNEPIGTQVPVLKYSVLLYSVYRRIRGSSARG